MRKIASIIVAIVLCSVAAAAHPGTALVTDARGNVYFAYWGGTWKLNPQGRLERIHANDLHFLAIDMAGGFARATLPNILRITPDGSSPALFAFSDYPATFHSDGYLYVAPWSIGRIRVERMKPDG